MNKCAQLFDEVKILGALLPCSLARIGVSGLGAVTTVQERATRAPDPWFPDQTLNPNPGSLRVRILRFYIP